MTTIDVYAPAPSSNGSARNEAQLSAWSSRIVTARETWFTVRPPAREWLLCDARTRLGVLPVGKVGALIGRGGVSKTMAFIQLAIAKATGTPWLGVLTTGAPGRSLLLLGEEDAEEVQRRFYYAARAMKVAPAASIVTIPLAGAVCTLVERDANGNTCETERLTWLREYVASERFDLIVVDPLSRFAGDDAEKDNAAATRFIQALESVAAASAGATVLFSHHSNKQSRAPGAAVDESVARGSTSITDSARWTATLSSERVDGLGDEDRSHLGEVVTLTFGKSNYSKKPDPVQLRRDDDNVGALVPFDAEDARIVEAARQASDPQTKREAVKEERARAQNRAASIAAAKWLLEHPGASARELRAGVRVQLGRCSSDRIAAGLAALGAAVERGEGPRNSVQLALNPALLDDDLRMEVVPF